MAEGHSGVGAIGFSRAPYAGRERTSTGAPGPSHDQALDLDVCTRARLCGQKITYFLEREYHVRLSVPKIYEILAEKYVIHSKWRKNQKRGAVPKESCDRMVTQNG